MNTKLLALPLLGTLFLGCSSHRDQDEYANGQNGAVEQSAPTVVVERPPVIVEEGSTYDHVIVRRPGDVDGYVLEGDQYYYWHPGLHVWVHVHHDRDWRPDERIHIYHHWREHPNYRREGHEEHEHHDR